MLIRDGEIAELGEPGALSAPSETPTIEAAGKHLFPAFVDPHVHLRTPGQEYKENIETGTMAAAVGGFCQVIAMPNTAPTIDQVSVLKAVTATASEQAVVPTGFLASITIGLQGSELTEMAALGDAGALGFTDDGKPVVSAGMLRKALQYQRLAGGVIALHEEDPALSGDGVMHEGAVSARLGVAGIPSISESTYVARDASDRALRGRARALPAPQLRRVGRGAGGRPRGRRAGQRRGDAPPPDAHRRGGARARQQLQDEPAAALARPIARR